MELMKTFVPYVTTIINGWLYCIVFECGGDMGFELPSIFSPFVGFFFSFISACLSKNLSSKRLFKYDYDRGFYLCKYVF